MKQTLKTQKDSISDLRNKWMLFYNGILKGERNNIVVYFSKLLDKDNEPYSLAIIQIEVLNKTKMARKMLKHLSEIGLI